MLLCWTLRKLSNIFTLETARYIREKDIITYGEKFSNMFNENRNFEKHIRAVHERIKDFKSEEFSKCFCPQNHLMNHLKTVHDRIKDYECKNAI